MFNLVEYRDLASAFMKEKKRATFEFSSGKSAKADLKPIYEKYRKKLFSDETMEEVVEAVSSGEQAEARSRKWLAKFAFEENFADKTLSIDEKISSLKSDSDYDYFQAKIRKSGTSAEAALIYEKLKQHKSDTRHLFIERLRIQRESFKWVNSASESSIDGGFLSQELGKPLAVLEIQLKQFISASEKYYKNHLEKFAKDFLSVGVDELEPWDIPLLLRGRKFDSLFSEWSPISLVKRTLMGLGVDLKQMENINIDTVKRRGRSVTPYCARIAVPEEISISLYPVGGVADVLNLFHLLGERKSFPTRVITMNNNSESIYFIAIN